MKPKLRVVPLTVKAALPWANLHHSHLDKPNGGILACGVETWQLDGNLPQGGWRLCCIALADHPARRLMDGFTLNVSRVASDGTTEHAASKCLAAISRGALGLGYLRLVSYTLVGEAGASYRAAGWHPTAVSGGGDWGRPSRPREAAQQAGEKVRWEFGPSALEKHLCATCRMSWPAHVEPQSGACEGYIDVDQYVRDMVGRVELVGRRETLPLFGDA